MRRVPTHVPVQVRSRFHDGVWARGFEVVEVVRQHDGDYYRVRRQSDGAVLPALFSPDDIREEPAEYRV